MSDLRHNIDHKDTKDGIVYKIAKTPEEFAQVTDFIYDVYTRDEPMAKALDIDINDRRPAQINVLHEFLKDGTSVIAIDPAKDDLLVGIRVSVTMKRNEVPKEKRKLPMLRKTFSEEWSLIFMVLDELMFPLDVFNDNPGHNKLMDFIALSTRDDYRGRGIAGELVNQAIEVAKKSECDSVVAIASSPYSRRIFEKRGMQEISRMSCDDLKAREEFKSALKKPEELTLLTGHFLSLK